MRACARTFVEISMYFLCVCLYMDGLGRNASSPGVCLRLSMEVSLFNVFLYAGHGPIDFPEA